MERLIRVRDGPTVSDPVRAEMPWIEAAQISSREDGVVAVAWCIRIDRDALGLAARVFKRVGIVMANAQ